jgi:MFS family permease
MATTSGSRRPQVVAPALAVQAASAELATQARRVALVSGVGTLIDYYDISVAGSLAATIWPTLFFPAGSFAAAFATSAGVTFGMTFLARPIGAILFGHFGDTIGRKATLIATLVVAALGTLGIAFAPAYAVAGFFGIILIVVCRFLFGLAMGGEMGGAITWTTEAADAAKSKRRGLFAGSLGVFAGTGVVLGSLSVLLASNLMNSADYINWGWRAVIIAATVILVLGGIARYWVTESPLFEELKKRNAVITSSTPIIAVLKERWQRILILSWIPVAGTTIVSLNSTFLAGYLVGSKASFYSPSFYFTALAIGGVGLTAMAATSAYLSDVLGRKRTVLLSLLIALVVAPIGLLVLFPSGSWALVMLGALLFEIPVGGQGAFFPLFAESFSTKYRQTGAGLSYQMSNLWEAIIFIVVVPVFYTTYGLTGSLIPLTVLTVALTFVGFLALRYSRETRGALEADF